MKHQQRLSRREAITLEGLYAKMYAGSLEYFDGHLEHLKRVRDAYLASLRAEK